MCTNYRPLRAFVGILVIMLVLIPFTRHKILCVNVLTFPSLSLSLSHPDCNEIQRLPRDRRSPFLSSMVADWELFFHFPWLKKYCWDEDNGYENIIGINFLIQSEILIRNCSMKCMCELCILMHASVVHSLRFWATKMFLSKLTPLLFLICCKALILCSLNCGLVILLFSTLGEGLWSVWIEGEGGEVE